MCETPQLVERRGHLEDRLIEIGIRMPRLREPQLEQQGDDLLLRTVVQIALESATLGVEGVDEPRARLPEVGDAAREFGLQSLVLEGEPGRAASQHHGTRRRRGARVDA